jgi:hypothetical protein
MYVLYTHYYKIVQKKMKYYLFIYFINNNNKLRRLNINYYIIKKKLLQFNLTFNVCIYYNFEILSIISFIYSLHNYKTTTTTII